MVHLKIKELREKAGLSQSSLARSVGITPGAVAQWERGETFPTIPNLDKLARVFGCEIADIFGPEEERSVSNAAD